MKLFNFLKKRKVNGAMQAIPAIVIVDRNSFDWPEGWPLPNVGDVIRLHNTKDIDIIGSNIDPIIVTKVVHTIEYDGTMPTVNEVARIYAKHADVLSTVKTDDRDVKACLGALRRAYKDKLLVEAVIEAIKIAREDKSIDPHQAIVLGVNEWSK